MAVSENAGVGIGSSNQNLDSNHTDPPNGIDQRKTPNDQPVKHPTSSNFDCEASKLEGSENGGAEEGQTRSGFNQKNQQILMKGLKSGDIRDLTEILSKLNPMAEEFVPSSLVYKSNNNSTYRHGGDDNLKLGYTNNFAVHPDAVSVNGDLIPRWKNNYNYGGKRRMNTRTSMAQREDAIRRTLYVSDIDQLVTEEQLAALFNSYGQVVDCRVCGDPKSWLRFAFIEFTDEVAARAALGLSGTILGYYPLRVVPSKTAIAPVNPTYLPRSEDEREMCSRTVYCTNIDKKVTQPELKLFFESFCGQVSRLKLLGDSHQPSLIAFVEFEMAESAIMALSCSGGILGSLPIRVSPSKTPVRTGRLSHSPVH
ncbi:hypothetical protein SAY87_001449 [Trapa incisa]|uniref:RRM domain-containing protein n=1 Tax=Trapa incisa TaxID=236973 RepID=A0AAN7GNK0_9MYRT|nr:hypothetical protein SAY87_001449 [Trapa incisa]